LVKRIPLKQGGERREREKREGAERERERENTEARKNRTDETRNYISKRTRRDNQIWETKAAGCDSTSRDKRSTDGLMD
jgi:hypothetical protein